MGGIDVSGVVGAAKVLKILHVIVGLNAGGAELMLKRLIETHIAESPEYKHAVVSLTDLGEVGQLLRDQQVSVSTLGMKGVLGIPSIIFRLYRILRAQKPDIVHTWMYHADLLGGLAARLAGIRNVMWGIRTTELEKGGKASVLMVRRICAKLSTVLPKYIVCAAEASRNAHVAIGYDSSRMQVIPNGFDLTRLTSDTWQREEVRAAAGVSTQHLVIGSLGRFNPVKDHETFISAAALLAKKFPELRFMLVGRGLDGDNGALAQMLKNSGYPERFVLLGRRQDVAACLAAMDIFCLHSLTEGFPNVLGEAMALQLPCVTTDVGDARYLLGDAGVVVPPHDPRRLAQGLEAMIEMGGDKRRSLGLASRQRISKEFTMNAAAERFAALYQRIILDGVGS